MLIGRPPGGKLTWLRAMGSRRAAAITAILSFFTGILITDGYTAYQQMLTDLTGIQQCAAHVIRRCRAVSKLGPGSLQSWATDVIIILPIPSGLLLPGLGEKLPVFPRHNFRPFRR